jgi:hypothetical protein
LFHEIILYFVEQLYKSVKNCGKVKSPDKFYLFSVFISNQDFVSLQIL